MAAFLKKLPFVALLLFAAAILRIFAYPALAAPSIGMSDSEIIQGESTTVTITGIVPDGGTYRFSIIGNDGQGDANHEWDWLTFTTDSNSTLCNSEPQLSRSGILTPGSSNGWLEMVAGTDGRTCTYRITITTHSSYFCNPGTDNAACRLELKNGSGQVVATNTLFVHKSGSANTITLEVASGPYQLGQNQNVAVKLNNMPSGSHQYTYIIGNESRSQQYFDMVTSNGDPPCSANSFDPPFSGYKCSTGRNAEVNIRVDRLNYNSPQNSFTYWVHVLENGQPVVAPKSFIVTKSQMSLTIDPTTPLFDGETRKLTLNGCGGDANFTIHNNKTAADAQNLQGAPGSDFAPSDTNTVDHTFDFHDEEVTSVLIIGICEDSPDDYAFLEVKTGGDGGQDGEEIITIIAPPLKTVTPEEQIIDQKTQQPLPVIDTSCLHLADDEKCTQITFNITGLETEDPECYFLEIQSIEGQRLKITSFKDFRENSEAYEANLDFAKCASEELDNNRNQGDFDRPANVFAIFHSQETGATTDVSIPMLPDGAYKAVLYTVNHDRHGFRLDRSSCLIGCGDTPHVTFPFLVGTGKPPPPPFPPCKTAYALDADGSGPSTKAGEIEVPEDAFLNGEKDRNEWLKEHKVIRCVEVNTAVGGWRTNPEEFVKSVMGLLLSISGAIALGIIIYSGYLLMTSQGDPERIGKAREYLTSAIVGLLFLIFSIVILEIIGVDILRLPGFGR